MIELRLVPVEATYQLLERYGVVVPQEELDKVAGLPSLFFHQMISWYAPN